MVLAIQSAAHVGAILFHHCFGGETAAILGSHEEVWVSARLIRLTAHRHMSGRTVGVYMHRSAISAVITRSTSTPRYSHLTAATCARPSGIRLRCVIRHRSPGSSQ